MTLGKNKSSPVFNIMTSLKTIIALICILNSLHFLTAENLINPQKNNLQTYIVHVDPQSDDLETLYDSLLPASTGHQKPRILYRYRHVLSGFAAKLSEADVEAMRQKKGFVSAQPERVLSLHTTHSPKFLGLNRNMGFWNFSNYGEGVIIGILDSGITPDHPSFSDKGMSPPPAKWKGKCEFSSNQGACNKKLIGARFFNGGEPGTPLDENGHGTHTAATATGNFVEGANILGNANGTAAGIAPLAHVAIYRVCDGDGSCSETKVLAGMDAAIEDGVDILSLSLGGGARLPFYIDNVALGAYRAMEKGILVSCSAGNGGPDSQTLSNEAPWILTVGASTIDRRIRATVVLGNGEEFDGESAFQPKDFPSTKKLDLYTSAGGIPPFCDDLDELSRSQVSGKIVLCQSGGGLTGVEKGKLVKAAGGAAMILMNTKGRGHVVKAEAHVLPASHITYNDSLKVTAYLNSTNKPVATILFKGTIIGGDRAPPVIAGFSSRGPSFQSPGILKPDIIGPGVNILAAWHQSVESKTNTNLNFNMISGTSMSCPHLSGVAALVKKVHPDWSPASIKSAIMTTADQVNLGGDPIEDQYLLPADVFAIGSGHVNPARANDPGLVYDIQPDDYIPYLCGLNYTNQQVGIIVQRNVDCSRASSIPEAQLNYPSFSIKLGPTPQTYTRTVINVGEPISSYDVEIGSPSGVVVNVKPAKLSFSQRNQKLSYNVTFSRSGPGGDMKSGHGYIKWKSARHSVRSPIAVIFG